MYIWSLYIGLSATVMSYLYLTVLPYYAQHVSQGTEADENLWWHTVFHAPHQSSVDSPRLFSPDFYTTLIYAFVFGFILLFCLAYRPWLPHSDPHLNLLAMMVWVGVLVLAARLDRLCYLLPDVLTQLLLWVGLIVMWQLGPISGISAISAAVIAYVIGRLLNSLTYFWLKQPLFGHGDVKLIAAIAAWLGWQPLLFILFGACVLCVIAEAIRQRRWLARGQCAFGPYIVLATLGFWLTAPYFNSPFNV